jgi:bacillithiol biosynthesis deacetylase BshB1
MHQDTDILAFGAHPDDVELTMGGLLLAARARGQSVVIVDLTRGEKGTRGDAATRAKEASEAARILGVQEREQLALPDCGVLLTEEARLRVMESMRRWRPRIVLAPDEEDLHPDHAWTGRLVREAAFLAGVGKLGQGGAHRPRAVLTACMHHLREPSFIVDISAHFQRKKEACLAYRSQFHNPASTEPETYIARPEFFVWWEARARTLGHTIGVQFGEGYMHRGPLRVDDPVQLFAHPGRYPSAPREP